MCVCVKGEISFFKDVGVGCIVVQEPGILYMQGCEGFIKFGLLTSMPAVPQVKLETKASRSLVKCLTTLGCHLADWILMILPIWKKFQTFHLPCT